MQPKPINHYCVGSFEVPPYGVMLEIRPIGLTLEQFRKDTPRLIAKLEKLIAEAHEDAARHDSLNAATASNGRESAS